MDTHQDQIKDLAGKTVEDFINHKVPLNEGIAKYASEMNLNSDQVQRLVEATNASAYLELMKTAGDRTFEFPIADYKGVMVKVAFPQRMIDNVDVKEKDKYPSGDGESINKKEIGIEARQPEDDDIDLDKQAYINDLTRAYMRNKDHLEKIAIDKQIIGLEIDVAVMALKNDDHCLEKIAEVSEEAEFEILKKFFHEKQALEKLVFRDSELKVARTLVGLLKNAKEIVSKEKQLQNYEDRSLMVLRKSAGIKPVGTEAKKDWGIGAKGLKAGYKAIKVPGLNLLGAATYTPKQDVWKELH